MFEPLITNRRSKFASSYWEAYSVKVQRTIHLFGDLHYDHWALVEANPKIKSFCEYPLKTQCLIDGNIKELLIDMWIHWNDGTEELVNIEYSSKLNSKDPRCINKRRNTQAQKHWAEENGYSYCVKTENDIRKNMVLLDNLKYIIAHTRTRTFEVETDTKEVINVLKNGPCKIIDIEKATVCLPYNKLMEAISWIIYKGIAYADIDSNPISPNTRMWLLNE